MPVALGIDFEAIRHTPAYRKTDDTSGVNENLRGATSRLLDLFRQYGISVTFFVVSDIIERRPDLIRDIESEGHEIASHTVHHYTLTELSSGDKRTEIVESKSMLENTVKQSVSGFRAPTCCVDDEVYEVLCEAGYEYSSSIMPPVPVPGFYSSEYDYDTPTTFECSDREIFELPLSISPVSGLPISGAWIRLLGRARFIRSVEALTSDDQNVLIYSHPWEFVDQRGSTLPFRCRFRSGNWLLRTYEELLSRDLEFVTVSTLAKQVTPSARHPID